MIIVILPAVMVVVLSKAVRGVVLNYRSSEVCFREGNFGTCVSGVASVSSPAGLSEVVQCCRLLLRQVSFLVFVGKVCVVIVFCRYSDSDEKHI